MPARNRTAARPRCLATSGQPPIAETVSALRKLGADSGWKLDATEKPADFTAANLGRYDVVVWLNATGAALSAEQRAAYENFHRSGKGTVAIPPDAGAAEATVWAWQRRLDPVRVVSRSTAQTAMQIVQDRTHDDCRVEPAGVGNVMPMIRLRRRRPSVSGRGGGG